MSLLRNRSMSFYLGCVLILVMATGGSVIAAFADSGPVTTTIKGGSLTESADFSAASASVILDGTEKTASYTLGITANDATGTGAGWHLSITSTQFHTAGIPSIKLSPFASHITKVTESCNIGSTCTDPTNSVGYPLLVPAASTAPASVRFYNASINTGLGLFSITPTISVTVPGNAYAGVYTSNVTVTVASGP